MSTKFYALAAIVSMECVCMQQEPPTTPKLQPLTKYVFLDDKLEKETRFHCSKSLREPLTIPDYIAYLNDRSPDPDNKPIEYKFRSTFRGSSFEVLPKDIAIEIENEIIKELSEEK
jgi:hypothetical protein